MKSKQTGQYGPMMIGVVALIAIAVIFGYLQNNTSGSQAATSDATGESLASINQQIKAAQIPPINNWTEIPAQCSALYSKAMDNARKDSALIAAYKKLAQLKRLEAQILDAIALAERHNLTDAELNWLYRRLEEVRRQIAGVEKLIKQKEDIIFAEFRKCMQQYGKPGGISTPTPPGGILRPDPVFK